MERSAPEDLRGRVTVVTGASSGIGAAVAETLAAQGARVALVARREEMLREVASRISAAGGEAAAHPADVTDLEGMRAVSATVEGTWGAAQILVNNAGVMPLSPVGSMRVEDWERMVDVNLKGVLFGVAAFLPGMLASGRGHIVNVGSLAGRRPFPGGAVYSATKFAVRAFSWGMQLDLSAQHGIRITDIQPGVVETALMDHIPDPETRRGFRDRWEGRRKLQPLDVARAVLFAVTAPDHVNVSEVLIRPTDQAT